MSQGTTSETTQASFKTQLGAWRRAFCAERLTIKSPLRDPSLKRRARELELSILVLDYGLHKLEGTGTTLGALPLGAVLREAGYDATFDILPQRGSLLDW